MPFTIRRFTKKIGIIFTIGVCILYALACLCWYLPPGRYWYIALLGVGYAFLLTAMFVWLFFWILVRSKWFLLPLAVLLVSWKSIHAFFAVQPMARNTVTKPEGSIRVMQWNVARFNQMNEIRYRKKSMRKQILSYIKIQDPDIICMQEFFESNRPSRFPENIPYFRDSLGYPYFYYAMDHRRPDTAYEHGLAIFSRYPIVKTFRERFGGPRGMKANESFIYVDVMVNGKTIRVFTTHLQSLLFSNEEFKSIEDIRNADDSSFSKSLGIFRKFKMAYGFRQQQAEMVRREMDQSPHPTIITGDFNDLPHSYVYHTIKGGFQDAYTARGFGVGRTFSSISPTLRIDFILPDTRFEVIQCRNPHPLLSDHFPVIADLRITQKQVIE